MNENAKSNVPAEEAVAPGSEIHVAFNLRGEMAYELREVRPHQLWAAARLLENLGDQSWLASQNARAAMTQQLALPNRAQRRVRLP